MHPTSPLPPLRLSTPALSGRTDPAVTLSTMARLVASGAAVWLPPGATFMPEDEARFETAFVAAAGEDVERLGMLSATMDEAHPTEPHHYLMLLGVVPDQQGTGVGSALLRSILDVADAAGEPAYLEATSPRNRELYERHGFEVTGELRCADCPPLWAMWRDPRAF